MHLPRCCSARPRPPCFAQIRRTVRRRRPAGRPRPHRSGCRGRGTPRPVVVWRTGSAERTYCLGSPMACRHLIVSANIKACCRRFGHQALVGTCRDTPPPFGRFQVEKPVAVCGPPIPVNQVHYEPSCCSCNQCSNNPKPQPPPILLPIRGAQWRFTAAHAPRSALRYCAISRTCFITAPTSVGRSLPKASQSTDAPWASPWCCLVLPCVTRC